MPILICAASGTEAEACRRGVRDAGLASEFEVLRAGIGLENARSNLERRLAHGPRPELIVSSGFAGAFSESIPLHGWITAREVYLLKEQLGCPRRAVAFAGAQETAIVSSAELIVDHEAREARYRGISAPVAVDMESASIAEVAANEKIPCMVLRMITDTPREPLPKFLFSLAAMGSAEPLARRARLVLRGARDAALDPGGVLYLLKRGPAWARLLQKGWSVHAPAVRRARNSAGA